MKKNDFPSIICIFIMTLVSFLLFTRPALSKTLQKNLSSHAWLVGIPEGTDIFIVNPEDLTQNLSLYIFDGNGKELNHFSWNMEPLSRLIWRIPKESGSTSIVRQTLCFASAGNLLIDAVWQEKDAFFEQTASSAIKSPLFIPHIAEQTQYWETTATWASSDACRFHLIAPRTDTTLPSQPRFSTTRMDLAPFLAPVADQEYYPWRSLQAPSNTASGSFSFRNKAGTQGAALPLNFVRDTYLILPHIPSDSATWWTGLVVLNPGFHPANLEITWHHTGSTPVVTRKTIEPGQRISDLIEGYSEGHPAQWAELRCDQSILGFELFGTRNEQSLCGLPLTNRLAKKHLFSRAGTDLNWSGISILNPGPSSIRVTLNQYSENGQLLRTDPLEILPQARIRFIPESDYPAESSPWLELLSDSGFLAFQLTGKKDQSGLAALTGLPFSNTELHLSATRGLGLFPDTAHTTLLYTDLDLDGHRDFLVAGMEGLEMLLNIQEIMSETTPVEPSLMNITYEEMGFEAEASLPPEVSVADLNGDGLAEILILDVNLYIFTLQTDGSLTRFQPQLPFLEGADRIFGYSDTNRDGFLDILTGRGYYKSLAEVENPYFTNFFPYYLRTSGRASRFTDLDGNGTPDILTSLNESFYGFLAGGSTGDLGEPIYTPDPLKTILSAFLKDMTGDGTDEVVFLLGPNHNAQYGTDIYIAKTGIEESRTLAQFPLPEGLAIGFLKQIETSTPGKILLKQEMKHATRILEISMNGIESLSYRTGYGSFEDFNNDGWIDQMAPWSVVLTEPNGRNTNPGYLFFDEAQASNLSALYRTPDLPGWVSFIEKVPASAQQIDLWEEHGFHRLREKTWSLNLPIAYPSYMEWMDYDMDGDRDILVAGIGLTVYLFEEDHFSITPQYIHPANVFTIGNARKCDLDGNEYPDLLGNPLSGERSLKVVFDYTSDHPHCKVLEQRATPWQVEFTDLNQDGLKDMLVNDPDYPATVVINLGNGSFQQMPLPAVFKTATSMDINASGNTDIIAYVTLEEGKDSYLRVYQNDGDLHFHYDFIQKINPDEPYIRLLALDINEDGRKDILGFSQSDPSMMEVWINQWNGNEKLPFRKAASVVVPDSLSVQLWDANTDGIQDLELNNNGMGLWLLNKTSYYAQKTIPDESR